MSSQAPPKPTASPQGSLSERLGAFVRDAGFEHFGFARLETPFSIDLYDQWVDRGLNGEMEYLERHKTDKRDPNAHWKRARSAIVITQNYVPHPAPIEGWPFSSSTRVAAYARGRDYHRFFHTKLKTLVAKLETEFPGEEFVSFADAGPVLERDLAARAGLGWIGKNTCLIDRKRGSLFVLGEIYTSLDFDVAQIKRDELLQDYCGTCTRCLDACPTQAITKPREVDARKCISYLTIEARGVPPIELREKIGDWLFGCDICQTVCPWNIKAHGKEKLETLHPEIERSQLIEDLRFILTSPNRKLETIFRATPLVRVNGIGLKRNALTVAGNRKLRELEAEVEALVAHPRVFELASWALEKIRSAE